MAKRSKDLREELRELRYKSDLLQKVDCSAAENKQYAEALKKGEPVPDNLYRYVDGNDQPTDSFYREEGAELSPEERLEYIRLLELSHINTIRKCVLYFTIVSIASAVLALLCAFIVMGS